MAKKVSSVLIFLNIVL